MIANEATERLRHKVLYGLTLSIVIATAIITLFNFIKGNILFSFIDGVLCLYSSTIFWQLHKGKLFIWQSLSIVYLYVFAVSLASIAGGLLSGIPFWLLTFPILLYLIFGRQHGLFSSGALLIIETLILYANTEITDITTALSILVNLVLAYFIVWTVAHIYEHNRESNENQLLKLALRDPLTHTYNRFALTNTFSDTQNDTNRTLAMIDIDHFKHINDNYGHEAGDQVLIQLTQHLIALLGNKPIFRIGGEEFVILFENTPRDKVISLMNSILKSTEEVTFTHHDLTLNVSISIGLSSTTASCSLSKLLKQADICLYTAKHQGRNQLVHEQHLGTQ